MNVPETPPKDPNLYCKSDLGAWQVAFQSPKCISIKYFKYLSITLPSSSGTIFLFGDDRQQLKNSQNLR